MKKLALTSALAATLTLSACADQPAMAITILIMAIATRQGGRVAGGAALGGVAGAVAGAVIPGVNPVTGAIAGAVLGGVAAAVINNRQYYRDTRGYLLLRRSQRQSDLRL